jgi:hypothetical protein
MIGSRGDEYGAGGWYSQLDEAARIVAIEELKRRGVASSCEPVPQMAWRWRTNWSLNCFGNGFITMPLVAIDGKEIGNA